MSEMYATITSKGQITLPVGARRALGLVEGQKVSIRIEGDALVIDAPRDIVATRAKLRAEAIEKGTWGRVPVAGDGWAARAEDHREDVERADA
ncbi:MAG TPA: AbrB/MazE/SpoVT family DNA-binding domain-containing protein [Terrimesophilobacter sp.]|nr:AbrB/MazE/SpoVT family DNA-binding domain-containing protein [Terrimesophilobacter sp.]HRQ00927.1 AbrB/MazE/SpoVT family DNA-binding domain-containing protein [Terrimesophilobacter sp.]